MGGGSIARELNLRKIPAKQGGQWTQAVVGYMLKNPVYKGYPAYSKNSYKGVRGRTDESLWTNAKKCNDSIIIIDEQTWSAVRNIREARKSKMAKVSLTINKNVPLNPNSKLLLVGMIHCGYCGSAMSTYSYTAKWDTKEGRKRKTEPAYKCNKKLSGGICRGSKSYYRKHSIEDTVTSFVFDFLKTFKDADLAKEICLMKQNNMKNEIRERAKVESNIRSTHGEIKLLKDEVVKSIQGTSKFSSDMLSQIIDEKNQKIEDLEIRLNELNEIIEAKDLEIEDLETLRNKIPDWVEIYRHGSLEEQRMMLCDLIEDVVVYKDKVSVILRPKINHF
jgi:hypothetical protein